MKVVNILAMMLLVVCFVSVGCKKAPSSVPEPKTAGEAENSSDDPHPEGTDADGNPVEGGDAKEADPAAETEEAAPDTGGEEAAPAAEAEEADPAAEAEEAAPAAEAEEAAPAAEEAKKE